MTTCSYSHSGSYVGITTTKIIRSTFAAGRYARLRCSVTQKWDYGDGRSVELVTALSEPALGRIHPKSLTPFRVTNDEHVRTSSYEFYLVTKSSFGDGDDGARPSQRIYSLQDPSTCSERLSPPASRSKYYTGNGRSYVPNPPTPVRWAGTCAEGNAL